MTHSSSIELDPAREIVRIDRPRAPTLLIASLTKHWPGQREPVLTDIDLLLEPGQLAWLTGANGAGKTTLLRIIAGIITPDEGSVEVCGLRSGDQRREYQRRIGLLTAGNSGLYARMTVAQHLDYWARLALIESSQRRGLVVDCIERFALGDVVDRRVDRLSMGQRQRVRIAMAFLHRPRLVLLDEPTNSLDEDARELLVCALGWHRGHDGAALWCSPAGERPELDVDRELGLDAGRLNGR